MSKLLSCLILVVLFCLLEACSNRRTLMTDAELDQERAGTVVLGLGSGAGLYVMSVAEIADRDQKMLMQSTCPPDCSILTGQAFPGETVTLQQALRSDGSVVTQRNSWTVPPRTRSITVLRGSNPNLPR